jgi:hypothetical protein
MAFFCLRRDRWIFSDSLLFFINLFLFSIFCFCVFNNFCFLLRGKVPSLCGRLESCLILCSFGFLNCVILCRRNMFHPFFREFHDFPISLFLLLTQELFQIEGNILATNLSTKRPSLVPPTTLSSPLRAGVKDLRQLILADVQCLSERSRLIQQEVTVYPNSQPPPGKSQLDVNAVCDLSSRWFFNGPKIFHGPNSAFGGLFKFRPPKGCKIS